MQTLSPYRSFHGVTFPVFKGSFGELYQSIFWVVFSLMEIVFVGFLNKRSYLFSDNLSKPSTMFVMSCFYSYLFWLHVRIYITQNLLMQRLKHFYLLLIGMRTLGSVFSKTCFRKKIVSIV